MGIADIIRRQNYLRNRDKPFKGDLFYLIDDFIGNGNYIARIRIKSEYELTSGWGERSFSVNVTQPEKLKLIVIDKPGYFLKLRFNNKNQTVFIYRGKFNENTYLRLAKTNDAYFDDYTAALNQLYKYFVRCVDGNINFSDSNLESGKLKFLSTTIAIADNPQDMVQLLKQIGKKPTKNLVYSKPKALLNFVGRKGRLA